MRYRLPGGREDSCARCGSPDFKVRLAWPSDVGKRLLVVSKIVGFRFFPNALRADDSHRSFCTTHEIRSLNVENSSG